MFDYERLEALSIEGEAPQSEPERQYYFMKKCRHTSSDTCPACFKKHAGCW